MTKLTVIGTTGAGKTTLIEKLKKEFESRGKIVEIVQEVARSSPWTINEAADDEIPWKLVPLCISCHGFTKGNEERRKIWEARILYLHKEYWSEINNSS